MFLGFLMFYKFKNFKMTELITLLMTLLATVTLSVSDSSCGGDFYSDQGTFHSPNYPSPYNKNEKCIWTISVSDGYLIALEFNTPFGLEDDCQYDSVKVFEVLTDGTRHLNETFCGSKLPPTFLSTTSKIQVEFKSDESKEKTGFSASWRTLDASCSASLNKNYGTIQSPYYPLSSYKYGGKECLWMISVDSNSVIKLKFNSPFEVDDNCNSDNVKVFDILSNGQRKLRGTWCGSQLPPTLVSSTSKFQVEFRTHGSNTYKGFSASWEKVDASCSGNYYWQLGKFHSSNYPSGYNNNENCKWLITARRGSLIKLEFKLPFRLENNCSYDSVKVFDVFSDGKRNLRGTWCGSDRPPPLVSTTPNIEVDFKSDGSNVYSGFSASWTQVGVIDFLSCNFENTSDHLCGYKQDDNDDGVWRWEEHTNQGKNLGHYLSSSRSRAKLMSARFSNKNNKNPIYCLSFMYLLFGANYRTLNVYVNDIEMKNLTLKWSQEQGKDSKQAFTNTNDDLSSSKQIVFEAISHSWSQGFVAIDDISFLIGNCPSQKAGCGGNLNADQGTIHSPNYPSNYNYYDMCKWTISVEDDSLIMINFNPPFELEDRCSYDSIRVFDVLPSGNRNLRGTWCGSELPPTLISSSSKIVVEFESDGTNSYTGFSASWEKIDPDQGYSCEEDNMCTVDGSSYLNCRCGHGNKANQNGGGGGGDGELSETTVAIICVSVIVGVAIMSFSGVCIYFIRKRSIQHTRQQEYSESRDRAQENAESLPSHSRENILPTAPPPTYEQYLHGDTPM